MRDTARRTEGLVGALWSGMLNAKRATSMLGTSIDISSGSIVVKNDDGPTYVTFDLQPRRPRLVGFR